MIDPYRSQISILVRIEAFRIKPAIRAFYILYSIIAKGKDHIGNPIGGRIALENREGDTSPYISSLGFEILTIDGILLRKPLLEGSLIEMNSRCPSAIERVVGAGKLPILVVIFVKIQGVTCRSIQGSSI